MDDLDQRVSRGQHGLTNPPEAALAGAGRAHRVVVLALPSVVGFELGLAHRLLRGGTRSGGQTQFGPRAPYDIAHVTADDQPVETSAGYQIMPTHPAADLAQADTVIIPGIVDHDVLRTGRLREVEESALDLVPAQARWLSICTGAFVLAARGLLDGRPCTTHWMHVERLHRLFPHLDINPDVLFVDEVSAHGRQVLTSAGNAAGIDLLLHVIRSDLGASVASHVAKSCVVAPWRDGGQAQFIDRPTPVSAPGGTAATREWALDRLEEDLSLARLAHRAGMSVRTFTRAFREETGLTAGQWLLLRRVERARHLLETTDWSVDRIAAECGFGTGASLRSNFRRRVGLAPLAYRRRFVAAPSAS